MLDFTTIARLKTKINLANAKIQNLKINIEKIIAEDKYIYKIF